MHVLLINCIVYSSASLSFLSSPSPITQGGTGSDGVMMRFISSGLVVVCPARNQPRKIRRVTLGTNITQARVCSSITDSSSCTSACREFLQDTVDDGGCCVDTVFNLRFSLLVVGYNIQVAFNACNIELPPACEFPVNLTIPNSVEPWIL